MKGASKKRVLSYCVVMVLAGLLAGCASTSETSTLQENLAILNQRQAALEKRVQRAEAYRKNGDLYARMQDMEAQIRTLNGRIDQVQHQVNEMEQKPASVATPQQPQTTPPSGTVVMQGSTPSSQEASPAAPPREQPSGVHAPHRQGPAIYTRPQRRAPGAPVRGRSAEQVRFDRGVQLLQHKNYEAARRVFKEFVSKYPKSGLNEDALYYIGECSFGERHYESAIKAFQTVVDRYPKGGKTASALLKEGIGWQEIGENTMARIIYTRLVTNYPGTAQARAAQQRLGNM